MLSHGCFALEVTFKSLEILYCYFLDRGTPPPLSRPLSEHDLKQLHFDRDNVRYTRSMYNA